MPKVSVIIPTYNRAEFLRSAIESALSQTFKDLEVVVADDKSTDHTREVVESFKDRRIKYILNEGKKGPSATRNTAILASEGEYIAFLDDDDEWLPDKLQRQVEVLDKSQPNICGVYSNRLFIDKTIRQGYFRQSWNGKVERKSSISTDDKKSHTYLYCCHKKEVP